MTGDVIEISPSPELEPRTLYRPLRPKRDPLFLADGNESAIELTDSTDSQSSTPLKRLKRRKEAAKPVAGPSTSSNAPVLRSRALSPRAPRKARAVSRRAKPKPHAHSIPAPAQVQGEEVQGGVQTMPLPLPVVPGSPQLSNHQLTPPLEYVPLAHESSPPAADAASEAAPEPHERLVERVREVVPDVLPAHVFNLLAIHETAVADNLLDVVIHILLEDRSYPKDIKGKVKARASEEKATEILGDIDTSVDYMDLGANRHLGSMYRTLSLKYLRSNFPDLDNTFILESLSSHSGHYAPTYLYLLQCGVTPTSAVPGRGKKSSLDEKEFAKEHAWLIQKLESRRGSPAPDSTPQDVEEGEEIECGCCFSSYPFRKMAQCTDTHLFCTNCMAFPDSELQRVLPEKLFELYGHIRQRRDIELAGLEGLEECPFCDYKVVMDADFQTDKVLRCQNEECAKVSCRKCKKEDHLPKSCEEMEEDMKLDGKHAIEEAMTRALMRNCPKCQKAFVKEYGCNKMTCTYCRTLSCYVCRSIIKGYDHFDESRPGSAQRAGSSSKKCPLWDPIEDRHAKEVTAAADKALKEYKTLHPDVQDEDIRVELPPPPPPPPDMRMLHLAGAPRFPPPPAYVQVHHAHNAHVPIAHPVVALPFPGLRPPPINPEHLFARGPPPPAPADFWPLPLGRRPLPRRDAPEMYPMPLPQPQLYNLLRGPGPFPMHPLPRPPLQQMMPAMQMAAIHGTRRMVDREKRRR
ncbi:hypothetical protein BJV74DRAFT_819893 [Russula compacta]|nr:hypothetical protein BJV74DRAFT_819893 [Russula compacta]